MSDDNPPNGRDDDDDVFAAPISNDQLATPALTPISEHGSRESSAFLDGEDELESRTPADAVVEVEKQAGLSTQSNGTVNRESRAGSATKLSHSQLQEFVQSPENLPVRALDERGREGSTVNCRRPSDHIPQIGLDSSETREAQAVDSTDSHAGGNNWQKPAEPSLLGTTPAAITTARPSKGSRSASTPLVHRKSSSSKPSTAKPTLNPLNTEDLDASQTVRQAKTTPTVDRFPSPAPPLLPIPPFSLPTYLQLELSSDRPSALYIHRSTSADFPYESSKVKFERLLNFLWLPHNLEQVLWFGAIACLDSWLYTFTILPLRFFKAISILLQWMVHNTIKELHDLSAFVYSGAGRVWQRKRGKSFSETPRGSISEGDSSRRPSVADPTADTAPKVNGHITHAPSDRKRRTNATFRHRRTKSTPSALLPNHKADILQGLLVIISCTLLTYFDASRMYHSIRGQAAIKLYVIYNVLEVFDRLFSALGQDVLECLFSKETLERNEHGRSKILRPLWMFCLALVYNVTHATALFYQVVTLNVAVNSYNNALLTLLMSNQFVEIKGTVFKKFDKENLFQMTCADIVERFQLWLLLLIIALRNIVEVGGLSISLNSAFGDSPEPFSPGTNGTSAIPLTSAFVIPKAFTLFPKWTGEVLGPFLIVLGSEALVDWCKHAYIGKFNNIKPNIYSRFLDVLAKDYYTHAFADQNLTKRLGLPVIPLSCLVIRACMQTYHMFLATHMPLPIASAATSISLESDSTRETPATTAALQHIDDIFRRALGRSSFGAGGGNGASGAASTSAFSWWSLDDCIAFVTMCVFFLALYLVLLALKLILGMALLSFARKRYAGMKAREGESVETQGKRVGRLATVEVGEDKRRWIFGDDAEGLREVREREERGRRAAKAEMKLDGVMRYSMAAKRIW